MERLKRSNRWLFLFTAGIVIAAVGFYVLQTADASKSTGVKLTHINGESLLASDETGVFYRTANTVSGERSILLPASGGRVFTWQEATEKGAKSFYAISLDGRSVDRITEADNTMKLRYAEFDPLTEVPKTAANLTAKADSGESAYIVQFVTQPLEEYRTAIRDLGAKTYIYLPNNAHIVKMNAETLEKVEQLPFVRWIGRYEPAYKMEEVLLDGLAKANLKPSRYNIMVLERGEEMQNGLADKISLLGGKVDLTVKEGLRMEATLSAEQLLSIANDSDVMFIDRWSAPETDMDVIRSVGGANFVETTLGFRGQGVRAEVMDNGLLKTHGDFQAGGAPIIHNSANTNESGNHGTSTYGINFGRGTANALGRGMLPEAQGIFADYDFLTNRYQHTKELKDDPYKAVYQSNSWGNTLTTAYTTLSAEIDDILFIEDFVLLNSQSNNGNQNSRPQAWSKNVVSIGGIRHYNTASLTDDRWASGASVGPAADGRLKPELAHFYDSVFTTNNTNNTSYTTGFGGTSSATPITAGHFGIFFQMWHNGLFGNQTGATVFDSRPHMTTAKAVMINTAVQWDMTIAGTDVTRVRQGFGRADVKSLYDLRQKMKIVNETDVLTNLQTKTYTVRIAAGSTDPLKITMVYADPMGSPTATRARINDLTLKVTAPGGTIYWGNNGLGVGGGMWSTSGGTANIVDTVENVFIQTPAAGLWTIEVIASEINQDARLETPGVVDADFALVASGISPLAPTAASVNVSGRVVTAGGQGIKNARVTITNASGENRTAITGAFGYYNFENVLVGETYVLGVSAKRFTFDPSTIVRSITDEAADLDFVAVN